MPVLVEAFVVVGDQSEAQTAAKLWNFIPKAFKGYQNIPDPAQIEQRAQKELPLPKVFGDWKRQQHSGRSAVQPPERVQRRFRLVDRRQHSCEPQIRPQAQRPVWLRRSRRSRVSPRNRVIANCSAA